ncbi:general stress protein [Nonomuraea sp. NPDC049152]|uniref:general stress protein n=1 Tax=Nonomuraea sp. NPDC049152 TaxID=3154350 RepID=UPI0033C3A1CF
MATSSPRSLIANYVPVAAYDSYLEAQKAVDRLSDERFPVQETAIVGTGLKLMEKVLGRMTYLRATGLGALSGAWFGLLVGLFFALFATRVSVFALIVWGLIWGAIAGAVFGLISHMFSGGQRDFVATSQVIADRYEVLVAPTHAERARELLQIRPT